MSDNDREQPGSTYPIADQPPDHAVGRETREGMRSVLTPGADVPALRREVRASIGDAESPVVEVDGAGQVVFVGGDWHVLTGHTKPGALALEVLLAGAGETGAVREAITGAIESRTTALFEHSSQLGDRWLKVVPIPSPLVAGKMHALVGLSHDDTMAPPVPVSFARHAVTAGDLAAVEARRASVGTGSSAMARVGSVAVEAGDGDVAAGPGAMRRGVWVLLAAVLVALVVVVAWSRREAPSTGVVATADPVVTPVNIPAVVTDFVDTEVADSPAGHRWREVGVTPVGSMHALDIFDGSGAAADTSGRLVRLDGDGSPVEMLTVGSESTHISDLVIDDTGAIWLLDAGTGVLHRVGLDGAVTTTQPDGARLGNARGIGLAREEGVWVAATAAGGVARVDAAGATLEAIDLPDRQPTDVVEADDGTLWIVDGEQYALVHIARDGAELDVLALEQFSSLEGPHLALRDDTLLVTAPEQSQLLIVDLVEVAFDPAIELARPDGSRLEKAIGIGVAPSGEVWVADSNAYALALVDPRG